MALAAPEVVEPAGVRQGETPICHVCGLAASGRFALCFCCDTLVRQLRLPLVPVVAMASCRVGDALHLCLRGYKDAPVDEVRRRHRDRLARSAERWLADHGAEAAHRFGSSWDVVVTVPSSRRPSGAPVDSVVSRVRPLADRSIPALVRGPRPTGHLRADRAGFALAPGCPIGPTDRIVVVDDTLVTGARPQSAAAVLRLAGLRVVGILCLGQMVPRV